MTVVQGATAVASVLFACLLAQASAQDTICRRTLDLAFAIDSSNSLGLTNFVTMMQTVSNAVNYLEFGEDLARVGASVYSTETDVIPLQTDKASFQTLILSLQFHDEGTDTAQGIRAAIGILSADRRDNTPIAIMLVSDGQIPEEAEALEARQEALNIGVDFWTVGVGQNADMEQLQRLASVPEQAIFIESFDQVPDRLVELTVEVCEESDVLPDLTDPDQSALDDLCAQSPIFEGVAYAPYPGDCTKVLQCYLNSDNEYLVVTRTCPLGQYWDASIFACADSNTVDCPYDECSCNVNPISDPDMYVNEQGNPTYDMSEDASCRGYWECIGGYSYPRCCAPYYSYEPGYGCKLTGECWDTCDINAECIDGQKLCYKYPDWTDPTRYYESYALGGTLVLNTCPYGGEFDVVSCNCEETVTDILAGTTDTDCVAYYTMLIPLTCNYGLSPIVLSGVAEGSPLALRFVIDLASPGFTVMISNSLPDQFFLSITGDEYGVHATLTTYNQQGLDGNTTTLFLNAVGVLDITVLYYEDVLKLSVMQGSVTHVSQISVPALKLCTDCQLYVATSGSTQCTITELELYTCEPGLYETMYV